MKARVLMMLLVTAVLGSCTKSVDANTSATRAQGRYLGIGIYDAGELWSKLAAVKPAKTETEARMADDNAIIVVVDSKTGEVRQCGNLSGACIAMHPWGQPAAAGFSAPVALTGHAGDSQAVDLQVQVETRP